MAYNEEYAKFYKSIDPSFFNMLDVESIFHKTFYPNACHVCNCFGEKVNLKRCGACDMISYCSKEHQLKDWSSHKEICKVIRQIKKELEVNNLYESLKVSNTFNGVGEMLSIFLGKFSTGLETTFGKSFKKISQMNGLKLIKDLSDRAVELLGRPLKYYELQMFSFPRVCAVCFECNPHLLTNCKKCPQSSFCEMHINDPSHENQCFKFISILYLPCEIHETVPPLILDIIDEMKLPVQTEFEKLPNSMTKFFERYFSKVSFHLFSIEKRVAFNTYFSSKYSSPLTILFAMEKLSLNLNSMTIHVVGASSQEQIFNDWEAILHYLTQLNKLKIVLIGLEFIPPGSVKMQKQCKLCKKNKRQFIIETIMIEYHKYCDS
ncbi:uncharacterized protein LOC127278971 [Leptopilina boulardi]|uniref:uncharacterized protein LOC127278971 n=1 Tax=Leptopilina boulardi TaxID=63433 RepID=UPI0021F5AAAE|nr:uncharacterized protein LOC127278971 [Leptopilina boulardi]